MPHIILEYSSNLEGLVDVRSLLSDLHDAVGNTATFDRDRIKSRAIRLDTYITGRDEASRDAMIHTTVVFSAGRSENLRKELGSRLLEILRAEGTAGDHGPFVHRSLEIRQFEDQMYFRDLGSP